MIEPDYVSVTQVLSPWSDFSRVRPEVLHAAALRGTRVHAIAAAILKGHYVPQPDPDIRGYVESFRRWVDLMAPVVVAVEPLWVCPVLGIQGHPDLVAVLKGDYYPTLIDLKTPVTKLRTWRLQIAGYQLLAEANGIKVARVASLRLDAGGGLPKFNEYSTTLAGDREVFLAAVKTFKFFS